MSEAAINRRGTKRRWAVPGSAHDRLIGWSKVVLPAAVGVVIAVLAVAPLDRDGDVSFILDKKKVDNAPERMRVESARYTGTDNKGQRFEIVANNAIQQTSDEPIVDIRGMFAQLQLQQGPVRIGANQGRYNLDTQQVVVDGPIRVLGPDGYRLATRDVKVDLKDRQVVSDGPVTGSTRLGTFEADQLRADLGTRTLILNGRARLKITQGAVR
ncbi:LPS export ABC transporter periplasmic protein LptC [Sphingomonas lutea]|uniref:LPS export ABC transporter periplasmic protein LptC n=1 Tax=Sphingomonas lutea TaxID=1045317 RepID=A0A7G9SIP0_9SPHN|nr:LPS export ABC transporter periplasmic protein LptC [Sphingomonas lutea]QNN67715.1 LPS export ABC transporter periplasmic protein LptC [Sphingomonas lutea]